MTTAITANPVNTPCTEPPSRVSGRAVFEEVPVLGAYTQPSGARGARVNVIPVGGHAGTRPR
ncbi:hypothetical protein GCM10010378_12710 [Streptomyces viridochromogenes]